MAVLLALLAVPAFPRAGAAQERLSLDAAVARAVRHNGGLRATEAEVDLAAAKADEARSALLPHVDFVQTYSRTDHPVLAFSGRLAQERLQPADLATDELNHPDPLDDFMTRVEGRMRIIDVASWQRLRAAARGQDAARAAARAQRAQVVAATVQAYHSVHVAEAQERITKQIVEAAEVDLERVQAQRDAGTATAADVAALRAEVAALQEARIRAVGQVEVARAELARVLGLSPDVELALSTPLDADPPAVAGEPGLSPDHPRLARAEAGVAAAEAKRASTRWAFAPTLGVQAAWERHAEDFVGHDGNSYFVGVELRMNLFAGLGDHARARAASAELAAAQARRDEAQRALESGLVRARRAVEEAEARREVTAEALEAARESHRLRRAQLEVGMAQTTDVLRARTALLRAEQRHLAALYAQHAAAVELAAARGTLDADFREPNRAGEPTP